MENKKSTRTAIETVSSVAGSTQQAVQKYGDASTGQSRAEMSDRQTESAALPTSRSVDAVRVAIVHDWMLLGGAEMVVAELLHMYPNAPLYTSCINADWQQKLQGRTVITGYLNKPFFFNARKFVPFLRQRWFAGLDFSGYDIVISSSGAEAKGISVPPGTVHINYCHAPTHYYWSRYEEYLQNPGFGPFNFMARAGLKLLISPMRKWDYAAAQKPHVMVANSTHIAAEIKKYYKRNAVVIHPPVAVADFTTNKPVRRSGFLVVGRQVPYKCIDLAVKTANILSLPLTVIGDGPQHAQLQQLAGPTVTLVKKANRQQIIAAMQSAQGFIFPGLDDFGITPVEALAAGCPVIAYKAGGALDYVLPGKTGMFFEEQTVESLAAALEAFQKIQFNKKTIVASSQQFAPEHFRLAMSELVDAQYSTFKKQ